MPGTVGGNLHWLAWQAGGAALAPALAALAVAQGLKGFFRPNPATQQQALPDPMPALRHEWLPAAEGIKLHTVRAGVSPGKPLMLMLHGFPECWYSWRHQLAAFSASYEVAAVDMRGYGQSDKPQGRAAYRMDRLVADVVGLLNSLGRRSAVLVGHDWGGNVAWNVAAAHPELVDRLVVMAFPHPSLMLANLDMRQLMRLLYIPAFQMPWLPEAALRSGGYAFLDAGLRSSITGCRRPGAVSKQDIQHYKQAMSQPGAVAAAINYYRCLIDQATRSPIPELVGALRRPLPMPTLLLFASEDAFVRPQMLLGTSELVPQLHTHILPDCSHWMQQDRPAEVNKLITDFLDSTSSNQWHGSSAAAS